MHYIDIDWNLINIWENKKIIKSEKSIVLRDLTSEEMINYGQSAIDEMSKPINVIAINCIENRKINSIKDFNIRLKKILDDNEIKEYKFVDRYNANEIIEFNKIDELDFLKEISNDNNYYVELRNDEIVVFDNIKNKINTIKKGMLYIQNAINSIFYLNHNATLNTKKTLELICELNKNNDIKEVICRSYDDGKDKTIKIESIDIFKNIFNEIFSDIKNLTHDSEKIKYDEKFKEVFSFVS
ncbi:hypothetical protein [Mesoplasma florum]|uniref:hypothetical protein n=1 Tax=Mesoplasma florum TaxID=2151 RepID=UPI000BE43C01|nr:hypothetical protein [Mesoplasma florum]ATI73434.1 hypothetical protein CQZ69_02580 [Mesoplasma florum]AVN61827.1 hypothetical protein CG004_02565 [Mesoplasma florum]